MANFPLPKGYQRLGAFPLDETEVYESLVEAEAYAASPSAYVGQKISVINLTGNTSDVYVILPDFTLGEIGGGTEYSFGNGLTLSGDTAKLGGDLTETTNINTGGYGFSVGENCTTYDNYSIAFGANNNATGEKSTAFGFNTTASGQNSVAFGISTIASGDFSTAFGANTKPTGFRSAAFGISTTASGQNSIAFGSSTNAAGETSTAFGVSTTALSYASTAFGYYTTASGDHSTAFGYYTVASGDNSTAFGYKSVASGANSFASGTYTVASGDYSTAFGYKSFASGYKSVSMGYYSYATSAYGYSIAIGAFSESSGSGAVAIGEDSEAIGNGAIAMNGGIASGAKSIAFGSGTNATASRAVCFGHSTESNGFASVAFGNEAIANAENTTAFGRTTQANGIISTAFGRNSIAQGDISLVGGDQTIAYGDAAVAFGGSCIASGTTDFVVGFNNVRSDGYGAILGGQNNTSSGLNSAIIGGQNITGTTANMVYVPALMLATQTTPTAPEQGTIYYDGTNFKGYNTTGWVDLDSTGGGGGTGTVTSVSATVPTGLTITGSPITTSGTLAIDYTAGYSIPTVSSQSIWSFAYSWGDHALAGYLLPNDNISELTNDAGYITSSTEQVYPSAGIALSTGTAWGTSIVNNSTNWNTAFGWGDHSTQGYITATSTATLSNKSGNISQWTNDAGYITTAGSNNYVDGISFNTVDGVVTLTRSGLGDLTTDLDGRYQIQSNTLDDLVSSAGNLAGGNGQVYYDDGIWNITTPATITDTTTNTASSTSHTHELDVSGLNANILAGDGMSKTTVGDVITMNMSTPRSITTTSTNGFYQGGGEHAHALGSIMTTKNVIQSELTTPYGTITTFERFRFDIIDDMCHTTIKFTYTPNTDVNSPYFEFPTNKVTKIDATTAGSCYVVNGSQVEHGTLCVIDNSRFRLYMPSNSVIGQVITVYCDFVYKIS